MYSSGNSIFSQTPPTYGCTHANLLMEGSTNQLQGLVIFLIKLLVPTNPSKNVIEGQYFV